MHIDELATGVEAHRRPVCAGAERLPSVLEGQRVERLRHLRVLVDRDLGVAVRGHVVDFGGGRQQRRLLVSLEGLKGQALRAGVPTESVLLEAPMHRATAAVIDGEQPLTAEAVLTDRLHGALDTPLVLGVAAPRGVHREASRLRVLQEGLVDDRRQRVHRRDDRLRPVGDDEQEHAAEEGPRRLTGFDRPSSPRSTGTQSGAGCRRR